MQAFLARLRRAFGREDGQALVELAFVLPILLLFVFGIIDFGMALNTANTNTNIANYAAREAAVIGTTTTATCKGSTETTIELWADCEAGQSGPSGPSVCVADANSSTPGTYTVGDPITVKVSQTFSWLSVLTGKDSYVGRVANPTSVLSSSATMRLEQSPSSTGSSGTNSFLSPVCTS